MTNKCYSLNDEDFNYSSFGELLSIMDEPMVGVTYWEADCKTMTTEDVMSVHTVNSLLEGMDEQAYEEIGEVYDNECSDVSDEAKAELQALISAWATKHINLGRFWKIVGKTRECKLTAEDLV
jgi:hypothetical protein